VDPRRRELVGELPANWVKEMPSTTGEHRGMEAEENQWALGAQAALEGAGSGVVEHLL
jgi:hypothetical protein